MSLSTVYRRANPLPQSRTVLLSVPEACAYLRVSRWTLYQLINQRHLLSIKIGRRRLIPATQLDELINRLTDEEAA